MTHIYHITTRSAVLEARRFNEYRAESLASEGFIHCSQVFQVLDVANAFYAGQTDLVILVIDPSRLKAQLKFEAPVHPRPSASAPAADNNFPHIYGPLNFDAVDNVVDFPLNSIGKFDLPAILRS
jgi:uncharacterized protein (DUF952 family)